MKTLATLLALILLLPSFSCKKVIQVNLNAAHPQIVIVGQVTNQPEPYSVTISKTVNFSDDNVFPPVSGATVIISDPVGFVDTLKETNSGFYVTHLAWVGSSGHTYTLKVQDSGNTYTAQSTMPQQVALDSLGFQHSMRGNTAYIEAIPFFQDPRGIKNYYQFTEAINGIPVNQVFIMDDRFSDGRFMNQPLFDDSSVSRIQPGDSVILGMFCIDSATYNYLNTLTPVEGNTGFQAVTPANPNTNLSGGALGYFSAYTAQYLSATAK
jgi:hypothetical protein